jgi:hypothetical protein
MEGRQSVVEDFRGLAFLTEIVQLLDHLLGLQIVRVGRREIERQQSNK